MFGSTKPDKHPVSYLNDGSTLFNSGNSSFTSKGDQFACLGGNLYKNGQIIARNVTDQEAKGIIEGMHGGKWF